MKRGDSVKIIMECDHTGKIGEVVGENPQRGIDGKVLIFVKLPDVDRDLIYYHEDLEVVK